MKKPALLLFPNLLGDLPHHELFLPPSVDRAVVKIDGLIAESEKQGRRVLSRFKLERKVHEVPLALLNEHSNEDDLDFLLEPMIAGERWGYVSDAGLPCIADPGASLVQRARERGVAVQAFVGPSSITLGLMLSGLPAQSFAFHGYMPRDSAKREAHIRMLEQRSKEDLATQIMMEAPYRNEHLLEALLKVLSPQTRLCLAWDLTLPTQGVVTQTIETWRKFPLPNIRKKPAIFMLYKS